MNDSPRTAPIVEDGVDDRILLGRLLPDDQTRYRVVEARTGQDRLEPHRDSPPDCVLLDCLVPHMTGAGVPTSKSLNEAERRFLARTTVRVLEKGEHRLSDVAALVLRAAGGIGEAATALPNVG